MTRYAALTAAVAALIMAATAIAAAPKVWRWTPAQAAVVVKAKVKIPYCKVYPGSANCATRTSVPITTATCSGVGAGKAGKYRLLSCHYELLNQLGPPGNISVTVIGKSTFRWKAA